MLNPPPLRNDCFALPEGIDWMPVPLALERLKDRMQCCVKVHTLPVDQALGAFLAQEVSAPNAHPPQANAAVDGFGFDGRLSQEAGARCTCLWLKAAPPQGTRLTASCPTARPCGC